MANWGWFADAKELISHWGQGPVSKIIASCDECVLRIIQIRLFRRWNLRQFFLYRVTIADIGYTRRTYVKGGLRIINSLNPDVIATTTSQNVRDSETRCHLNSQYSCFFLLFAALRAAWSSNTRAWALDIVSGRGTWRCRVFTLFGGRGTGCQNLQVWLTYLSSPSSSIIQVDDDMYRTSTCPFMQIVRPGISRIWVARHTSATSFAEWRGRFMY